MEIIVIIIGFGIIYFKGYFDKKGQLTATKEQIGSITKIVEEIKKENSLFIKNSGYRYEKEYQLLTELTEKVFKFTRMESRVCLIRAKKIDKTQAEESQERTIADELSQDFVLWLASIRPFIHKDIDAKALDLISFCMSNCLEWEDWFLTKSSTTEPNQSLASIKIMKLKEELYELISKRVIEWE